MINKFQFKKEKKDKYIYNNNFNKKMIDIYSIY